MSIFTLFSRSKKSDAERMQDAAHGRAVLGDLFGSSPYMKEWRRQNKEIGKQYRKQEKALRKEWREQDKKIQRSFDTQKSRYGRRMDEKQAAKFYGRWEEKQRGEIQRQRGRVLESMERERHEQIRNIGPTIKQYK